ncbi:universal stress protein [Anderseniella sp. Alg231-50]|uniref:universal stress protein n=1 Tax=Anderseniella sp. Alg231-50 TaxID=1922226 RepID=UPI000D55BF77
MFKKILVPVDLTHNELGVQMINLAKEIGGDSAEIILTHVVHDIPSYAAVEISGELLDKTHKWAKAELEKLAKDNNVSGPADLRHGSAGSAILEAATQHGADLVIIGSHKPGVADYFLGSTAGRVVRHAQCPVLVMR